MASSTPGFGPSSCQTNRRPRLRRPPCSNSSLVYIPSSGAAIVPLLPGWPTLRHRRRLSSGTPRFDPDLWLRISRSKTSTSTTSAIPSWPTISTDWCRTCIARGRSTTACTAMTSGRSVSCCTPAWLGESPRVTCWQRWPARRHRRWPQERRSLSLPPVYEMPRSNRTHSTM